MTIVVRGDAGFGVLWMYDACESAVAADVGYTFGLAANPMLKKAAEPVLQRAVEQFAQTGEAARSTRIPPNAARVRTATRN